MTWLLVAVVVAFNVAVGYVVRPRDGDRLFGGLTHVVLWSLGLGVLVALASGSVLRGVGTAAIVTATFFAWALPAAGWGIWGRVSRRRALSAASSRSSAPTP